MPYCRECGNMVNEGNAFCHECGAKLKSEAPKQDYYEPKSSYSYEPEVPQVSKRNAVLSFVFGLINTELAIFALLPYACFFFFPACLIFSILGIKRNILALLGIILFVALHFALILLLMSTPFGFVVILPLIYLVAVTAFIAGYASYPIIDRYLIEPYAQEESEDFEYLAPDSSEAEEES